MPILGYRHKMLKNLEKRVPRTLMVYHSRSVVHLPVHPSMSIHLSSFLLLFILLNRCTYQLQTAGA